MSRSIPRELGIDKGMTGNCVGDLLQSVTDRTAWKLELTRMELRTLITRIQNDKFVNELNCHKRVDFACESSFEKLQ